MKLNKKTPNSSGLVKKTDLNTNITSIEKKMPSITGLVTTSALIRNSQIFATYFIVVV